MTVSLRATFLNTALMPPPLGLGDNPRRAGEIASRLIEGGTDLIGLCEVFASPERAQLESSFVAAGYACFSDFDRPGDERVCRMRPDEPVALRRAFDLKGGQSGLFLAVKKSAWLLDSPTLRTWRAEGGIDGLSSKGTLVARIIHRESGASLEVAVLHMQSGDGHRNREIRSLQFAELSRFWLERKRAKLLLGDFNIIGELFPAPDDEYSETFGRSPGLVDEFRRLNPDEPGYTWDVDNPLTHSEPTSRSERLDYVLTLQNSRTPVRLKAESVIVDPMRGRDGQLLSDHSGVSASLILSSAG
ncbi:MAG: hypothetical protein AUK47_15315 [Deltaproteobacteria bacterium CG2_30_63_29]|nr:MAG: hypothetical protein AUK47_15315 [Deltaproteobacteria bacterium CG2_30_63_29]PIW01534.1 MAG: hypothetical protein COW42_04620 [Deltaproteobacteria bacterium CG17_big_fil_post_rev_8_21_14_2_50_63_7]PJB40825.1 MAG: hypothetical protein CO108_14210 [Deltaproteobacteria bacterium CG_4_9_14_3_um_filter_63_12]